MRVVRLASELDLAGWRAAARRLRAEGVTPDAVTWSAGGAEDLFAETEAPAPAAAGGPFTAPRTFLPLAEQVIQHRSEDRFALLYRLLWRFADEPRLLEVTTDGDVARALGYARGVSRAAHKMKAFVRFREVVGAETETYVAWFEPVHRVVEATAPHFAGRFANMRWSILTPDGCVHWDLGRLSFTPGADAGQAPAEDALEDYWRTYYASIFNPARLKVGAMQSEMPKRYWRNLPEARLIPELIAAAHDRTVAMVERTPVEPSRRVVRAAQRLARDGAYGTGAPESLEAVVAGVDVCRRCDLWRDATQGVPGAGPGRAKLMFVGEQPGDQEDLAGKPFVGPAGQMLDRALREAEVPRGESYVTNAVKHFKHELRGKRRIHQTPHGGEVQHCRWWLDAERRLVRPQVVVALGATAALAVFGKPMPIGKSRGQAFQLPDQSQAVVTYHPSYLLRVPDAAAKAEGYAAFVADLKFAWGLVG
jgi:probable DNA metabolism protein